MDNRLKNVMASVFDIDVGAIGDDASPDTIENWDSLNHINLIMALEEEFGVSISSEEASEMLNYKLIEMIIKKKIKC